jgi:hypothetical protein
MGDQTKYVFDETARTLSGKIGFDLSRVVAIYGDGETLSGDVGEGSSTVLYPVYSPPEKVDDDKITRIWDDGTVAVQHNGETVTLAPGEEWVGRTSEETTGPYNMGLIRLTTTDTIINHGFIERKNIEET